VLERYETEWSSADAEDAQYDELALKQGLRGPKRGLIKKMSSPDLDALDVERLHR
jgi:hypothetical protein